MNLSNAPFEQLLRITAIADEAIEKELNKAGLRVGVECHKHLPATLPSVRIKGPEGSVVLGGGLSNKVLIKCGSITKYLGEIQFKDNGVITEINGGCWLQNSLQKLGLALGSKIRLMRRLPPMEYVVRINNQERIKLSESTAARIIGKHEDGLEQQFSSARVELDFKINSIVGGRKFSTFLKGLGISRGEKIVLEGLEHVNELFSNKNGNSENDHICLKTIKGSARIHISNEKANYVEVTTV